MEDLFEPNNPVYKLWAKRVSKVFTMYFAAAGVSTSSDSRIGIPLVASRLGALSLKYSAEEFCTLAKPNGLMIAQ